MPPPIGNNFRITRASNGTIEGTAKPNSTVEIVNLSTAAVEGKKTTDTVFVARADQFGRFTGALPTNVQGGDVLRLRNADGSAPMGNWLTVRAGGLDKRNAQVAVENIALSDAGNGQVKIAQKDSGKPVSEPGAYVEVRNLRSGEHQLIELDDNGNIPASTAVKGLPGDTFSIRASDGTNNDHLTEEAGKITLPGPPPRADLPDPKLHSKYTSPGATYQRFSGPLFRDGASPLDVKQGYLGDCYLCSAAAALAQRHADVLQKAMKDNGDGTYTVTFKKQVGGVWKDVPVTVDGDIYAKPNGVPVYGKSTGETGTDKMELWFPILEKAWAEFKGKSYDAVGSGGQAHEVMTAVLGKAAWNKPVKYDPEGAWKAIKSAVDKKQPVVAGTYGEEQAAIYTNSGVHADHAYTVMGYEERADGRYVQLRNPWAHDEPLGDGVDDGVFMLKFDDFKKFYQNVHVLR